MRKSRGCVCVSNGKEREGRKCEGNFEFLGKTDLPVIDFYF